MTPQEALSLLLASSSHTKITKSPVGGKWVIATITLAGKKFGIQLYELDSDETIR